MKMLLKLKPIIAMLLFLCIMAQVLTGCSDGHNFDKNSDASESENAWNRLEYTPVSVKYSEPGEAFSMVKGMDAATVNSTTYGFEKSIFDEERISCIQNTNALLEHLHFTGELQIYVYDEKTYNDLFVTGNTVYTHLQDWKSAEYFAGILLGVYGEFSNYGMIYGYANYLREQLFEDPIDVSDLVFAPDFAFYDMNYLCFHPDFASVDDISTVKSIANAFVDEYIASHGEDAFAELLRGSGDDANYVQANQALNEYYRANGVAPELTNIRYKSGGNVTQYVARCEYATFCVPYDWKDNLTAEYPQAYDGFLNRDYVKTNDFFKIQANQMRQYQEYFALDRYDNSLEIYFSKQRISSSEYIFPEHIVNLGTISSLMHEYIHSITHDKMSYTGELGQLWAHEGFTRHYDTKFNKYKNEALLEDYSQTNTGKWLTEKYGRPLDLANDWAEIWDVSAALKYPEGNLDPDFSYGTGASFVNYLIKTYGEREVLDYILRNHDLSTLTEKPFDEIVSDWKNYIQSGEPLK